LFCQLLSRPRGGGAATVEERAAPAGVVNLCASNMQYIGLEITAVGRGAENKIKSTLPDISGFLMGCSQLLHENHFWCASCVIEDRSPYYLTREHRLISPRIFFPHEGSVHASDCVWVAVVELGSTRRATLSQHVTSTLDF
jgi:hypothetical protein